MESNTADARITRLLDNEMLSRVERMRLRPQRRLTNRSRGEHYSGKGGASTEFADYRDYVEGDDTRFVDWNIFARLHRPYLKLFHHEEEMHVVLLIDASSSMDFEGKFTRACELAAALGVMGLFGGEKVSVYAFNSSEGMNLPMLPPCTGRPSLQKLLRFVESIAPGGQRPLEEGVEAMLRRHVGRGMAVLLSDFLTFGDLQKTFNRLYSANLEPFALQILSASELNPELSGDARLVDSESQHTLDITSASDLLALYHEHLHNFQAQLESLCQSRSGRYACVDVQSPLKAVLLDQLQRRGWIR